MKVEVSHCAACGEKNSKWVQNCHRCGALLPWADGYQASQNAATSAVTVEISPLENTAPAEVAPQIPAPQTSLPAPIPITGKPIRKTSIYAGWAVAGVLGIACIALLMRGNPAPQTLPAAKDAAAPTANPTAQNLPVFPTSLPETAPTPIVNAPVVNTPVPTFAPPVSAARPGPSFAEIETNLTDSAQKYTYAQKQQYWNRVQNSRVTWRGAVVNVSSAGQGEIVLKCNPQSDGLVTIALDGSQLARLPAINKNQVLNIEGILQGHSAGNYQLSQGRIVS